MVAPGSRSATAARTKPSAVSVTKVKSRFGVTSPRRSSSAPASSCDSTVGMTARADWRGPKVLNGRRVVTGVPKDRAYDSHILSAPIFDAEYGDWPRSGCASVIGTCSGVP